MSTILVFHPYPEHQNYFGVDDHLGPVAVSIRRERLDDGKEKDGMQSNYRVTFRTSQVTFMQWCSLPLPCLWSWITIQLVHGAYSGYFYPKAFYYVVFHSHSGAIRGSVSYSRSLKFLVTPAILPPHQTFTIFYRANDCQPAALPPTRPPRPCRFPNEKHVQVQECFCTTEKKRRPLTTVVS